MFLTNSLFGHGKVLRVGFPPNFSSTREVLLQTPFVQFVLIQKSLFSISCSIVTWSKVKDVWLQVFNINMDITPLVDTTSYWLHVLKTKRTHHLLSQIAFSCFIWKARNQRLFQILNPLTFQVWKSFVEVNKMVVIGEYQRLTAKLNLYGPIVSILPSSVSNYIMVDVGYKQGKGNIGEVLFINQNMFIFWSIFQGNILFPHEYGESRMLLEVFFKLQQIQLLQPFAIFSDCSQVIKSLYSQTL